MRASTIILAVLAVAAASAAAEIYEAPLLLAGEDERVEGVGACPVEPDFVCGLASAAANLAVGGNAWGCDSEFGASLEFDLSGINPALEVLAAELVVRMTGHEEGLP